MESSWFVAQLAQAFFGVVDGAPGMFGQALDAGDFGLESFDFAAAALEVPMQLGQARLEALAFGGAGGAFLLQAFAFALGAAQLGSFVLEALAFGALSFGVFVL